MDYHYNDEQPVFNLFNLFSKNTLFSLCCALQYGSHLPHGLFKSKLIQNKKNLKFSSSVVLDTHQMPHTAAILDSADYSSHPSESSTGQYSNIPFTLLKTRQWVQNKVTYAKPQATKPRLNWITIAALPGMESYTQPSWTTWLVLVRQLAWQVPALP